jgi:hypothetical protein
MQISQMLGKSTTVCTTTNSQEKASIEHLKTLPLHGDFKTIYDTI